MIYLASNNISLLWKEDFFREIYLILTFLTGTTRFFTISAIEMEFFVVFFLINFSLNGKSGVLNFTKKNLHTHTHTLKEGNFLIT